MCNNKVFFSHNIRLMCNNNIQIQSSKTFLSSTNVDVLDCLLPYREESIYASLYVSLEKMTIDKLDHKLCHLHLTCTLKIEG